MFCQNCINIPSNNVIGFYQNERKKGSCTKEEVLYKFYRISLQLCFIEITKHSYMSFGTVPNYK